MIDCNHIYISQSIPLSTRLYPTLNLMGYSLGLWGILWELPDYTLGYSPEYTRVYFCGGLIWAVTPGLYHTLEVCYVLYARGYMIHLKFN